MEEIWKDIQGFEGMYQISNLGKVRSLDRKSENGKTLRGKIRTLVRSGKGYLGVGLRSDGKQVRYYVHRLVAMAFVEGYDEGKEVNHINENKHDNRAVNLEWVSRVENLSHGTGRKRQRENLRTKQKVEMLSDEGMVIAEFSSLREAERATSARHDHISQCCKGNPLYKTVAGYKWRFKK